MKNNETRRSILPRKENEYRIFIFNPETDYALAAGRTLYNVPSKIVDLRRALAYTPAVFGSENDVILLLDDKSLVAPPPPSLTDKIEGKNIRTATLKNIASIISQDEESGRKAVFTPWGWNHTLHHLLTKAKVSPLLLPSVEKIDDIRRVSHRRTAGNINSTLSSLLPALRTETALEFTSAEEAIKFCESTEGPLFLKAPWSSSGRGVICTSECDNETLGKWISGCIRRQSSVMIERGKEKTGDFASEWWIEENGEPCFLGLSMFKASAAGRYLGNINATQDEIESKLRNLFPCWKQDIIKAQQEALRIHISPSYSGPVGIDMLTTADCSLVPCVEVNLRFTMGMVELFKSKTAL